MWAQVINKDIKRRTSHITCRPSYGDRILRHQDTSGYRAFTLPGQFAPRSESANRTLANSLPGPFAPWNFRSQERNGRPFWAGAKVPGSEMAWERMGQGAKRIHSLFAPGPIRSLALSFPGTFAKPELPTPHFIPAIYLLAAPRHPRFYS